MRRLLLLALLSGIWTPAAAQVAVSAQMEEWYGGAARKVPGLWGVVVADQDGNVLWSVNASEPMTPASTVKVLTTGFVRTMVGSDARQPTRVTGVGTVDPTDGTWRGSWALELNGDPTFGRNDTDGVTFHDLAAQLRAIGVRKLAGPLQLTTQNGNARSAYPSVWPARHRGRYYAPPVGPITVNENLVAFTVSPGEGRGKPTIVWDDPVGTAAMVSVEARTVAGRTNRLTVRSRGDGWVVSGTIGERAPARRYSLVAHDPAAVVDAAWFAALERAGITWDRNAELPAATGSTRILAEVASPTFDEIAEEVNRRSVNIAAELMLRWGGGTRNAADLLEQHVRDVTGLKTGIHLVDGSGLADANKVAPVVFTTYLAAFPRTQAGRDYPLLLPTNGTGTLRRLGTTEIEGGVVRAKTGSINNTSTLVGYLGRSDGMLVVAAMYNGSHTSRAREEQWELFRALGADGVVIPPSEPVDGEITLPLGGYEASTR